MIASAALVLGQAVSLGQIWAPVISAVLVAGIASVTTVVTTRSNRQKAQSSATDAGKSASIAEDAAKALEVKNAVIDSLEQRVAQLENDNQRYEERCNQLEATVTKMREEMEEMTEALRSASLLERERSKKPTAKPSDSTPHSPHGSHRTLPGPSS